MAVIEEVFHIISEDKCGGFYRVRPNPDVAPGHNGGVIIEYSDNGKDWEGYFFVSPDCVLSLSDALRQAAAAHHDK